MFVKTKQIYLLLKYNDFSLKIKFTNKIDKKKENDAKKK